MTTQIPCLPLFSSKVSSNPINTALSVFCSPHDLIAVVTADSDIVIYRLNGQIAFTVKCKDPGEVTAAAVQWKPDGSQLAVGWSDGSWAVYEGGSGRPVGEGRAGGVESQGEWKLDLEPGWGGDEEGGVSVGGFGWEKHTIGSSEAKEQGFEEAVGWDLDTEAWADGLADGFGDFMVDGEQAKGSKVGRLADLPTAIATLDATKVLPRLSAIPSHGLRSGPEGHRFGTQAATDGVFESKREGSSDSVDVLLVYTDAGEAHVLLDETVPIGTFSTESKPLCHASNPRSSIHALLSKTPDQHYQVYLQELPLPSLGGPLLHVIARDTKRIQSILAYLTQTLRCITHDYTTGLQFPTRLMNNINTTLSEAERPSGDLVHHFTHLAMTGHFSPEILEWLTDIVKEPNHKRWDQAIGSMYAHIQTHSFVNILPALDRMSIAVCCLRGHATLHQDSTVFGLEPSLFTNILGGIDALRLIAQQVQLVCVHEWQQFRAFSKWLRLQIEIGTAGPYSKNALEAEEKEVSGIDYGLVLGYVKETMAHSKLAPFVQKLPELGDSCSKEAFFEHPLMRQMGYENTKAALERPASSGNDSSKAHNAADIPLLNLQAVAVSLTGHVRAAMDSITKWQSRMLAPPIVLDHLDIQSDACDMRLLVLHTSSPSLAVLATDRANLYLYLQPVPALALSQSPPSCLVLSSASDGELLDAKFVSDDQVLFLRRSDEDGTYSLISVEIPAGSSSFSEGKVLHAFDADEGFAPESLLVGGRKGKEVCVVFGDEGRGWRVLDLAAVKGLGDADGWVDEVDTEMG